jgi:NADPH-dependent ferric siderophore reductase
MSSRAGAPTPARVLERRVLSDHLVRLRLGLTGWTTSDVPDEWVALTVPGQFQTRYYTVRSATAEEIVLDVVVHDEGLVTAWATGGCEGDEVGISVPRGSFTLPDKARWLVLVADLTGLPALARIHEWVAAHAPTLAPASYVEAPEGTADVYPDLPAGADVRWLAPPAEGESALAEVVRGISWPEGPGYFWMAGESAQMREIRRHLRHDVGFPAGAFDVMGYWSGARGRGVRTVDPGPIYERGKRQGKSDEQIWADYDDARKA